MIMTTKYRIESGFILTARKAQSYIGDQNINRNLLMRSVNKMEADITNGDWIPQNGSTIVFDWDNKLRDGQHRCHALIMAQNKENALAKKEKRQPKTLSISVDAVRGVDPAAVRTIDIGSKRSVADTLVMEMRQDGKELKAPKVIAGALKIIVIYEKGNIYDRSTALSNEEAWQRFQSHSDLIDYYGKIHGFTFMFPKGIALALYKIFSMVKAHREMVHPFFYSLATGENLVKKSPLLTLRNRILSVKTANGGERISQSLIICFIIKAWSAYVKGESLSKLVFTPDNLPQPIKKRNLKATLTDKHN